ncbi:MAG: DUF748 domain-containing protein [Candidatus Omnitrophica bacterium]|jgi:hypothetical protein|nr:DUF748 domain-containing protein [Candidatus Omnitrophota bacterium]
MKKFRRSPQKFPGLKAGDKSGSVSTVKNKPRNLARVSRRLIIAAIILFLSVFGTAVYLNKVFFPQKIKSMVVSALAEQTGRSVSIKSLEFSFFKGFVMEDLVISEGEKVVLSARRANCAIFIWPIFKKQIIIPGIRLSASYLFLQRRPDGTFNIQDIFNRSGGVRKNSDFSLAVFGVNISDGSLVFEDDTLEGQPRKEIRKLQLNLRLGLPVKFRFNLSGELSGKNPALISAAGEYKILSREFAGNLTLKGLSVRELEAYYGSFGKLATGVVDLQAKIGLKNNMLQIDFSSVGDNMVLEKNNLKAKLDFNMQVKAGYDLAAKSLVFEGACDIWQADISGLEFLGPANNLSGRFVFNQRSLVADCLKVELMGLPFKVHLGIKDFTTPVLNINTELDLKDLPGIAREKFNFPFIDSAGGRAVLSLKVYPDSKGIWAAQGGLDIAKANLKLDKVKGMFEEIGGRLGFSSQGLNWTDLVFKYRGDDYRSSGSLFDFANPKIQAKLFSRDLSLTGDFELPDKKIKIGQLKGKYLGSQFCLSGQIDRTDPVRPWLDLDGSVSLELPDLEKLLDKNYPAIKKASPRGELEARFVFKGWPGDFKNCYLRLECSGGELQAWGLKGTGFVLDYLQEQKIAKINAMSVSFYDGLIEGSGAMNLDTAELIYWLELAAKEVKLEKLKLDTSSRTKDLSGVFAGQVKLNGAGIDLGKLNGAGNFSVNNGKLGELNLLKGLGRIILVKDLGSIEFDGCSCDFTVNDKAVSSDKFNLTGKIATLSGPVKIGFDGSLEGALNVEILSEMIPVSGTLQDVTTAIIGKGGKFGVIKIGGSLEHPKYSFNAAMGNIIQGLAEMIFKK